MFAELFSARSFKTMGVSLGFGLLAALVMSLLGSIVFLSSGMAFTQSVGSLPNVPSLSSMMSNYGVSPTTPNFFQVLVMVLVMGVSGSFSLQSTGTGTSLSAALQSHFWMPVGLSGVALMVGAAFGSYWFARKLVVKFKWVGVISSVIVGVVMGFIYLILAAIFPVGLGVTSSSNGAVATIVLSGVSVRTYFLALLLAALGAFAGYLLAQYASDSNNVFSAAWKWAHRTRGCVRTVIEAAWIYTIAFFLVGVVVLIWLSAAFHSGQVFLLLPIVFPGLPLMLLELASFGVMDMSSSVNSVSASLSLFGISVNGYTLASVWQLWLVLVVFLLVTFYVALRAAARNIYDPAYMGWQHSWKAPVTVMVLWLVTLFLGMNISEGASTTGAIQSALSSFGGSSYSAEMSISPAVWYFLVAGVWAFLIEVVALTFGRSMVVSMGGLWKIFVGGTVRPTPDDVTAYAASCKANFGRYPASVAAAAGYVGQAGAPSSGLPAGGAVPPSYSGGAAIGAAGAGVAGVPLPGAGSGVGAVPAPTTSPAMPGAVASAVPGMAGSVAQAGAAPAAPAVPGAAGAPGVAVPNANGQAFAVASTSSMPAMAAPMVAPVAPAAAKAMTAQQKRLIIIISVIVGVLAALGITFAVLNSTVFSAENTAKSYLSAIASGDYDKASSLGDPQIPANKAVLLTNAAAKKDGIVNQRIVSSVANPGGSYTVKLAYSLNGKTINDSVELVPDGSKFLIFKNWKISTPLLKEIYVTAPQSAASVTVNGVKVTSKNSSDDSDSSSSMSFKVYPGKYEVKAAKSKYISAEPLSLNTNDNNGGTLDVKPTDALSDAINTKVKDALDKCAASKDAEPEGCPFSMYDSDSVRNVSWSIVDYPNISADDISLSGGSFYGSDGEVKVTYEYQNFDNTWDPENDSTSYSVSGKFEIDGDKVTVDIGDSY